MPDVEVRFYDAGLLIEASSNACRIYDAGLIVEVLARPVINSVTPDHGSAGTVVTIDGQKFGDVAGIVTFNGLAATIGSWGDTEIVCTAPMGVTDGPVVVVSDSGLSSNEVWWDVQVMACKGRFPAMAIVRRFSRL